MGDRKVKVQERMSNNERRRQISHEVWEEIFDFLQNKYLIFDFPQNYYDEEIYFKESNDLDQQFDILEHQNLFSIKHSQEIQEQIEQEQARGEFVQSELGGQSENLKAKMREKEDEVIQAKAELFILEKKANIV